MAHAQFENTPSPAQPDNVYDRATVDPRRDSATVKILEGSTYAQKRAPVPDTDTGAGALQTGELKSWPRLYRNDDLLVTGIFNGAIGLFGMTENLFGPPPSLAGATYQKSPMWAEFFLEPGVSAQYKLSPAASVYGSFSYVESSTRGSK